MRVGYGNNYGYVLCNADTYLPTGDDQQYPERWTRDQQAGAAMNRIIKNYNDIEKNYSYDELALYFGDDYIVNDNIHIHQPTIGEIAHFGEREYFQMVYTLCAIPSDMKATLDDMGLDYAKLPDFDLFMLLTRRMTPKETGILFGELDL